MSDLNEPSGAEPDDPMVERLDDARERVERLIASGLSDPIAREMLSVREDLVFLQRLRISEYRRTHLRINHLEKTKVDKNPGAARTFWVLLPVLAGGIVSLFLWLVTRSVP